MLTLRVFNSKVEIVSDDADLLKRAKKCLNIYYSDFRDKTKLMSFYVGRGNSFPAGYLSQFEAKATKKKIEFRIEDHRNLSVNHVSFDFDCPLTAREHQTRCLESIKNNISGIVSSPTGSGKSFMIAEAIRERSTTTLVITPTTLVRDSLAESFKEWFGLKAVTTQLPQVPWAPNPDKKPDEVNIGDIDDEEEIHTADATGEMSDEEAFPFLFKKKGKKKEAPHLRAARSQYRSIQKKLERGNWFKPITIVCWSSLPQLPNEFIEKVGAVMIDECHTASVDAIRDCLFDAISAPYRYGFSATPWRDQPHMLKLMQSSIGSEIIFDYNPIDAIEEGMIARPNLNIIQSEFPEVFLKKEKNYRKIYDGGIIRNRARNRQIVKEAIDLQANNHQVFIAIAETSHFEGKMIKVGEDQFGEPIMEREKDISYCLKELFAAAGEEVITIFGDDTSKEKMAQIKALKEMDEGFILIGTMAFGIGTDVPGIDKVIMAGAGKSSIQFLQRMGRGIRTDGDEQKELEVFDFMDRWNPIMSKHSIERVKIFSKYYKGCKVFGF